MSRYDEHKWVENGESYSLIKNRGDFGWIHIGFVFPMNEELTAFHVLDAVHTPLRNATSLEDAEQILFTHYYGNIIEGDNDGSSDSE